MISIIITSYKEPRTIRIAIDSFLKQNIEKIDKYEIIVAAPDLETQEVVKKYMAKHPQVYLFKDPGKGKSLALNLLLPKIRGDIIILSDGDVYVSKNSVSEILKKFKNPQVGCVSGRVASADSRNTLFGFWSHLLCYAAHILRKKRSMQGKFLECSGYLWAFRNNVIKKFPRDVAEDTIVPILFWLKGYKIEYAEKAIVYVKFPINLKEFIKQKKRTIAGHENLEKYIKKSEIQRMKTLKNEITESLPLLLYPKTIKEFFYTLLLFPLRLYIWLLTLYKHKIKKQKYSDAWKRIETTK